jgi:hypothetical protein
MTPANDENNPPSSPFIKGGDIYSPPLDKTEMRNPSCIKNLISFCLLLTAHYSPLTKIKGDIKGNLILIF